MKDTQRSVGSEDLSWGSVSREYSQFGVFRLKETSGFKRTLWEKQGMEIGGVGL